MISNLEQLQADIQAVTMETEYSVPHSASMNTLSLPRSGNPFEDDDKFYSQPVRKSSSHSANSAVFEKLDVNDDGELNEDEFVGGCLKDETLANLLNTGAAEEQKDSTEEDSNL